MRILLIGYGTMNKITAKLAEDAGHEIAGVIARTPPSAYESFKSIDEAKADVAIDFSNPELLLPLIEEEFTTPLVVATTGEKEKIVDTLKQHSINVPVFFSANMSYGVHAFTQILKAALNMLEDYDVELTERHHNKKVDAPSGTLVKLLDEVLETRKGSYPVYDRSTQHHQRDTLEIGVSSIRGGSIVGTHDVIFAGEDEVIELRHQAQSKDIFAHGALKVAEQLITRENGYYTYHNLF
jgi:4-hydroxy-tetrahydrodipicolinate reductase